MLAHTRLLARNYGVPMAAWYAMGRLLEVATFSRLRIVMYRIVVQPVPDGPETPSERTGSVVLRWLEADDALLTQMPRPAAVIARRFRDGAQCLAAVRSARLVGFLWYKEIEYLEDEVRCLYRFDPAAAVWDFDVYVDPEFRLGRLFSRLWTEAHGRLRRHGYRWTISRISAFNLASLAAHARMGARIIASATFLVVGPVQISFANMSPRFHASWRCDRYPTFEFVDF